MFFSICTIIQCSIHFLQLNSLWGWHSYSNGHVRMEENLEANQRCVMLVSAHSSNVTGALIRSLLVLVNTQLLLWLIWEFIFLRPLWMWSHTRSYLIHYSIACIFLSLLCVIGPLILATTYTILSTFDDDSPQFYGNNSCIVTTHY